MRDDDWINQIWSLLASPRLRLLLLFGAGLFFIATPLFYLNSSTLADWWSQQRSFSVGLTLPAMALVTALFSWLFERLDVGRSNGFVELNFGYLGKAIAIVGIGLFIGSWFYLQKNSLSGRLRLSPGDPTRVYQTKLDDTEVDVAFPGRLSLESLSLGSSPTVNVRFLSQRVRAKSESRRFQSGDRIQWADKQFVFTGFSKSERYSRAILALRDSKGANFKAPVGTQLELPDGEQKFQLLDATPNYLDMLGPAVEIQSEKYGRLWLFARESSRKARLHDDLPVELVRLEKVPKPIFHVRSLKANWPVQVAGGLLGIGLFFVLIGYLRQTDVTGYLWIAALILIPCVVSVVFMSQFGGEEFGVLDGWYSAFIGLHILAIAVFLSGFTLSVVSVWKANELTDIFDLTRPFPANCRIERHYLELGMAILWLAFATGSMLNWIHRGGFGANSAASWIGFGTLIMLGAFGVMRRRYPTCRFLVELITVMLLVALYTTSWYFSTLPGLSLILF